MRGLYDPEGHRAHVKQQADTGIKRMCIAGCQFIVADCLSTLQQWHTQETAWVSELTHIYNLPPQRLVSIFFLQIEKRS